VDIILLHRHGQGGTQAVRPNHMAKLRRFAQISTQQGTPVRKTSGGGLATLPEVHFHSLFGPGLMRVQKLIPAAG
jgi:hypothetical protein